MTIHDNDPKRPVNDPVRDPLVRPNASMKRPGADHKDGFSSMSWIVGALALIATVGLVYWAMSDRDSTVATIERPAATAPVTTGPVTTGTTLPPPAGSADTNVGTAPTPPVQR